MCTHSYKNFSPNKRNHLCQLAEDSDNLPIDGQGLCVFHSSDLEWKREHDFVGYLKKYVSRCRQANTEIDLREVNFVGSKRQHVIDYLDIISGSQLIGSVFHDLIEMKGKTKKKLIPENLVFQDCLFKNDVKFEKCLFKKEVGFSQIRMENNFGVLWLQFEHCDFEHYFDLEHIENFSSNLSIADCHFHENVSFDSIQTEENCFDVVSNTFHEKFTFKESEINTLLVNLSNNTFEEEALFSDMAFYSAVEFNAIKAKKLRFIGSAERKIFYGETNLNFKPEDVKDQITFQQTQLTALKKDQLDLLKQLEKTGEDDHKKVVIGSGCIKYRWQASPKTIKIDAQNAYIIEEFSRSFTVFLSKFQKSHFGVEILERTPSHLTFFYFSDEDLGTEFYKKFAEGQELFFGMLTQKMIPSGDITDQDALINMLSTRLSQNSALLQARLQSENKHWNIDATKALVEALTHSGQKVLDVNPLHNSIISIPLERIYELSKNPNVPLQVFHITTNIADYIVDIEKMDGNINHFGDSSSE